MHMAKRSPAADDPGAADSGTEDSGTEDPGTEDPGTEDPAAADPGEPHRSDPPGTIGTDLHAAIPAPAGLSGVIPDRQLEIETKLDVDPGFDMPDFSMLHLSGGRRPDRVTDPLVYELGATYYDTAELNLLASRLTLRRRTGGTDAGWHLKLPAGPGARTEVTLPLSAGGADRVPLALADLVQGAARGRPLLPVARLRTRRTARRLLDADGRPLVEIADDEVRATRLRQGPDATAGAGRPAGSREKHWRELEVELIGGHPAQAAAVVDALLAVGARPATSVSKLARALDAPTAETRASPRTAGDALLAALIRHRDALTTADRELREADPAADALHDARAAARRIRAVLTVFGPLLQSKAGAPLRTGLKELGVIIGAVRDLDVAHRRLADGLAHEPAEFADPALSFASAMIASHRLAGLATLRTHLSGQAYLTMLTALDDLIAAPRLTGKAGRPADAVLPELLAPAWRRLRALAETALADLGHPGALHEVRKAAKTVRYAAEAAAAALGNKVVVFAASVEEVQEILGEFQDSVTTAALLAGLASDPATPGPVGFALGRVHAFEQAVEHGAIDDAADAWARARDGAFARSLGGRKSGR